MRFERAPDNSFGSSAVIVADADGTHERTLATRPLLQNRFESFRPSSLRPLAWSPDGSVIAVVAHDQKGAPELAFLHAASGSGRSISMSTPSPGDIAWVDSRSLVLTRSATEGAPSQLWRLSYPGGQLSRLTNDLTDYVGVSLTKDGTLATLRAEGRANIWIADASGQNAVAATPETAYRELPGPTIAWMGDRLLYTASATGQRSIAAVMPGASTAPETLVSGSHAAVTPDGRIVVFISEEPGRTGIWKVDADGRHPVKLADGQANWITIVPSEHRVLLTSGRRMRWQSLWSVPLDGGSPTEVLDFLVVRPDLSPDGKSLLFGSVNAQNRFEHVICELPACKTRRTFATRARVARWTPDGRAIVYLEEPARANFWALPLDGTPARQLTHFTDRAISDFAWSPDGKQLAIARTLTVADIVLFKGLSRLK